MRSDPLKLEDCRVAIIGLGLMGGSLAMALKGQCTWIYGIDPDRDTINLAKANQVCDQLAYDPVELLPDSDLIILATPIRTILTLIEILPSLHPGSPVVIDMGSIKVQISQSLERLPSRFEPIGGHPICGKETSSLANADPSIYSDAAFAFTPLVNTTERARNLAEQLARKIKARPVWLTAETHDRWIAATSHLPYLIANLLAVSTPPVASSLVGPGWRSTTRLAGSSLPMMLDIVEANHGNILDSLRLYRTAIESLEESLEAGDMLALEALLSRGADNYQKLVSA